MLSRPARKITRRGLWLPLLLLSFHTAQAAVQGEAGETSSTAVTTITLTLEPNIQISNVSDIELNVTDRSQDISIEERICVRGNVGSRYSMTAAGQDGGQNPFPLRTNTNDVIAYELYFRGDLRQDNLDRLSPGDNSPFYAMQTNNQDCNGDDTAAMTIIFRSEQLLGAAPGVYTGFLTLTVAAE